jgi:hypothetical protein
LSAHFKSIIIDISETRLINYARYVVLWLISYVRKKWPLCKTRSAAPHTRQTDKPVYISRRWKRTCLFAMIGLPQVIYSGSGWMKLINPLNLSDCYITHVPAVLTLRTPAFGPHFVFRSVPFASWTYWFFCGSKLSSLR